MVWFDWLGGLDWYIRFACFTIAASLDITQMQTEQNKSYDSYRQQNLMSNVQPYTCFQKLSLLPVTNVRSGCPASDPSFFPGPLSRSAAPRLVSAACHAHYL